jgi:beta-lactam-binding protein with PASTA domain
VYDSTKPEGVIIDQDPLPNSKKIKEGATITLKVNSSGVLVTVPNVKGLAEEVAKAKISNAGLKSDVLMVVDEETAVGIVCNVDPQEGSKVTADSTVRLYVSKGPADEKVSVPDVINKSLAVAKNDIVSAGLKVSDNIVYESSDKPKDTVISTDPLPGISVGKDSAIKLTVSSGVKREKNIEVAVDLPSNVNKNVTVTSYINGVLDSTKTVNPSLYGTYSLYIKGTSGKKTVNIYINKSPYRVYEVDFDASSNNVKKLKSYDYTSDDSSEKSSDSNKQESPADENAIYH